MLDFNVLLLLIIAALLAWFFGRQYQTKIDKPNAVEKKYYQGLNYLLNHQTDKALDIFLESLEVNKETLDTHLALGNAFRRKGEVDKAIQIHQNLLARSGLTHTQMATVQFELANDFIKAGLLDRAEELMLARAKMGIDKNLWGETLLDIMQRQQDWQQALQLDKKYYLSNLPLFARRLSHFACELVQKALAADDVNAAKKWLKQASSLDVDNPRVCWLSGKVAMCKHNYTKAIAEFNQVVEYDQSLILLVLEDMAYCHLKLDDLSGWEVWLAEASERYTSASLLVTYAQILQEKSDAQAMNMLAQKLQVSPTVKGFHYLLGLYKQHTQDSSQTYLTSLQEFMQTLEQNQAVYACKQCGFNGAHFSWQCPTCSRWDTFKPVYGILGE